MGETTAHKAVVATNQAAYVYYSPDTNKVFVWNGDTAGRIRVYDPQTWELVECWQGGGPIRDRWECRERIREYGEGVRT